LRRFRDLEAALGRIREDWVPPWLQAIGSPDEIAEWRAIRKSYHGPDLRDREVEFEREMHRRHPGITTPLTIDEIVLRGGRDYAAQQEARYRQLLEARASGPLSPSEEEELKQLEEDMRRVVKIGDEL
jgi:hypothetical protein